MISQFSWSSYLTYFRKLLNVLSPPPRIFSSCHFEIINAPSGTIALTSNKKRGVDCKTSAHRSSVPWTPEENAKNSYEEHDPQRPIAHSLHECGLSILTAFDMPRFSNPCRDSKYHRYDFEFLEQSPVNNKQANDTSQFMRHSTRRKTRM